MRVIGWMGSSAIINKPIREAQKMDRSEFRIHLRCVGKFIFLTFIFIQHLFRNKSPAGRNRSLHPNNVTCDVFFHLFSYRVLLLAFLSSYRSLHPNNVTCDAFSICFLIVFFFLLSFHLIFVSVFLRKHCDYGLRNAISIMSSTPRC